MMLARLSATAASRSTAATSWIIAARAAANLARRSVGVRLMGGTGGSECRLHVALAGRDQQLPERFELRLGLDDVVAYRAHALHQLLLIRRRQRDELAALLHPELA